ncbi:hypothetical protein JW887_04020 [Candidatus Dojkabacteria bacterium]|nr:hypothetical protein [Candidatus Dojkabacteria bacterium]
MDTLLLRKSHQPIIDRLLYFANGDSDERRKVYEDLFLETWERIPKTDHDQILENLEFVLCKRVDDFWNNGTPACALLCKISLRSFVVFDPFVDSLKHVTKIHILAHELAHVYYNHPRIGYEKGTEKEIEFIEKEAEPQAYSLTEERWNIFPHKDDIARLKGYKKYVETANNS